MPRTFTPVRHADQQHRRARRLTLATAGSFGLVVVFQLALVAGAPWGSAAYGGAESGRLPGELRVASALQALIWILAGLTALSRGGLTSPVPYTFSRPGMWALTALLAIGAVMNAASPSPWERYAWAPFILVLCILSIRLARSRIAVEDRQRQQGAGMSMRPETLGASRGCR
jgi:hypothetical protein